MATLESIDDRIQALDQRLTQRLESLTVSVDTLTRNMDSRLAIHNDQIGRMTENLTRLENLVIEGFRDLKEQSKKRDEQIDRLLSLLERLIPLPPAS